MRMPLVDHGPTASSEVANEADWTPGTAFRLIQDLMVNGIQVDLSCNERRLGQLEPTKCTWA